MTAKSGEASQFWIIMVASFKISNSESVIVKQIKSWTELKPGGEIMEESGIFKIILDINF